MTLFHIGKTASSLETSHSFSTPPKRQLVTFNLFSHTRQFALFNPDNERCSQLFFFSEFEKCKHFFVFSMEKPKTLLSQPVEPDRTYTSSLVL